MNKEIWQKALVKYQQENCSKLESLNVLYKVLDFIKTDELKKDSLGEIDSVYPYLEAESAEEAHEIKERIKKGFNYTETSFDKDAFKNLLLQNGYTVKSWADAASISIGTVQSWVAANGKMPRPDKLKVISDFFRISIESLLK